MIWNVVRKICSFNPPTKINHAQTLTGREGVVRGGSLGGCFCFKHKNTNKTPSACTLLAFISLSKQRVAGTLLRAGEEEADLKVGLITAL